MYHFGNGPLRIFLQSKYVYDHLSREDVDPSFSRIWRSKLSEKIKILMWFLEQKGILTKDNMIK
jgi:hypothetical protein